MPGAGAIGGGGDVVSFFQDFGTWIQNQRIDRKIDALSQRVEDKLRAIHEQGRVPTPDERLMLVGLRRQLLSELGELARARKLPLADVHETSKATFHIFREWQEIFLQGLAGKHDENLRGGAIGDFINQMKSDRPNARAQNAAAMKVANELSYAEDQTIADAKLRIVRANIALIGDRGLQEEAIALLAQKLREQPMVAGVLGSITALQLERSMKFEGRAAVRELELPNEIKELVQRGKDLVPNRPISNDPAKTLDYQNAVTREMRAAFDQVSGSANEKLFIDTLPNEPRMKISIKTDHNLGVDGEPSVTPPISIYATIAESLRRAKEQGKDIWFSVGDMNGAENTFLGRATMETLRDTGAFHYALKAGLEFAKDNAPLPETRQAAARQLAEIERCERDLPPFYFGSKEHLAKFPWQPGETTRARRDRFQREVLGPAEQAASRYVRLADWADSKRPGGGFKTITPDLDPVGLGVWGSRQFKVAKDWEGDDAGPEKVYARIHVTRGSSTHILAGITGPLKGMIGAAMTGLRPMDQGMNSRGDTLIDLFPTLTQATGFMNIFQKRSGVRGTSIADEAANDPGLKAKWGELKKHQRALDQFNRQIDQLRGELKDLKKRGVPEEELFQILSDRTRDAIDNANDVSHGFADAYWEAARESTKVAMRIGHRFRQLFPSEVIDESLGLKIGAQTQAVKQPDLVVTLQTLVGKGGGPDAYDQIFLPKGDKGALIVSTNTMTNEIMANRWARMSDEEIFAKNYPLFATAVFNNEVAVHPSLVKAY